MFQVLSNWTVSEPLFPGVGSDWALWPPTIKHLETPLLTGIVVHWSRISTLYWSPVSPLYLSLPLHFACDWVGAKCQHVVGLWSRSSGLARLEVIITCRSSFTIRTVCTFLVLPAGKDKCLCGSQPTVPQRKHETPSVKTWVHDTCEFRLLACRATGKNKEPTKPLQKTVFPASPFHVISMVPRKSAALNVWFHDQAT